MRSHIGLIILAICFMAGCSTTGVPTELANACNEANEKKYLEVSGFIASRGSVFCSNIGGGRVECGFDLKETPEGDKKMGVEIEQGSGANTVDKLERGFKKEDIKIRDNAGNQINLATDKVRVTGQMSIGPGGSVCFMKVTKIER